MSDVSDNKNLYSKIWKTKRLKSHTFWDTWKKFETVIPKKNPKLLDVGCGIRPRIPVKGSYFLDLSEKGLSILKSHGGICSSGSVTDMPYKDTFFDFINASELIEHVSDDDKALSEISRVLKKNGYFSFSIPLHMKYWSKFDEAVHHQRRYDPRQLLKKLKKFGFTLDSYYMNEPSKSKFFKNLAAFVLKYIPNTALFIEEYITLPIAERLQKSHKKVWLKRDFVKNLKNAGGVVLLCQKI